MVESLTPSEREQKVRDLVAEIEDMLLSFDGANRYAEEIVWVQKRLSKLDYEYRIL